MKSSKTLDTIGKKLHYTFEPLKFVILMFIVFIKVISFDLHQHVFVSRGDLWLFLWLNFFPMTNFLLNGLLQTNEYTTQKNHHEILMASQMELKVAKKMRHVWALKALVELKLPFSNVNCSLLSKIPLTSMLDEWKCLIDDA